MNTGGTGGGGGGPVARSVVLGRPIHVVLLRDRGFSVVQAVQEPPRDLRHHGAVGDGLGHAVDGAHASGFLLWVLHDDGHQIRDVADELLGHARLRVQQGHADVDAGREL